MTTRSGKPPLGKAPNYELKSRFSAFEDTRPDQFAQEKLQEIKEAAHQSVRVASDVYYYYRKKTTGRRCSCWSVESGPDGHCPICFGIGRVGGFDKHGTHIEVLDITYPNLRMVNIYPNFYSLSRPVMFELSQNAVRGYIEAEITIPKGAKCLDIDPIISHSIKAGQYCTVLVKGKDDTDFVEFTKDNLDRRSGTFLIRVLLQRDTIETPLPILSHIYLRWRLLHEIVIHGDETLTELGQTYADYGVYDSFATRSIFFDDTIKEPSGDDFVINVKNNSRWKLVTYSIFAPSGVLSSWTAEVRYVQRYEPYMSVP